MKVIEYLKKFSFAELKTELEKLYINNECCGFYNFTIEQWNAIYNLFGYQKDVETANVIHLKYILLYIFPFNYLFSMIYLV